MTPPPEGAAVFLLNGEIHVSDTNHIAFPFPFDYDSYEAMRGPGNIEAFAQCYPEGN